MIKNQRGVALVMICALLPVLLTGLLICFSAIGFIQKDASLKYHCRTLGQKGQSQVAPLLTSLMALNPMAQKLRLEYAAAALRAALHPMDPSALANLQRVVTKQMQLDRRQKQIIRQSNMLLLKSHTQTRLELYKAGSSLSNILFKGRMITVRGSAPKLAVRPDYTTTAPVYELKDNFSIKQSLAHEWHYELEVRPPFSNFIEGKIRFNKACAVSLKKESLTWKPQIIVGKFSLKSVW